MFIFLVIAGAIDFFILFLREFLELNVAMILQSTRQIQCGELATEAGGHRDAPV
jgi:hypothetical protein